MEILVGSQIYKGGHHFPFSSTTVTSPLSLSLSLVVGLWFLSVTTQLHQIRPFLSFFHLKLIIPHYLSSLPFPITTNKKASCFPLRSPLFSSVS
uniref:Uncharacterized protein n=1 Tax=Salix viminalis TaxID=40686 RepID=A0A6N2M1Z2_SALVM